MNLKWIKTVAGPVGFLLVLLLIDLPEEKDAAEYTLGILVWMAIWWIFEPIPLGATALLPIVLFPLFYIMPTSEVTLMYGKHIIFLFAGGFMVAYAMEKCNLHKRIALYIISKTGVSAPRIILGFMLSSFLLSMWISNTATTLMLMAPAYAVLSQLESDGKKSGHYATGLLIGIAYAASIGGTVTLVGTPPNLIFYQYLQNTYSDISVNFTTWLLMASPGAILLFIVTYFFISNRYGNVRFDIDSYFFQRQFKALGPVTRDEKIVLGVFISMALLWITHKNITIDDLVIYGWESLLPESKYITDSSVAVAAALVLFVVPSSTHKGHMLLNVAELKRVPYNILLLFGGGFALAEAVQTSGLSEVIGNELAGLQSLAPLLIVMILTIVIILLTEVSSNSAAIQLALPIMSALALSTGIPHLKLLIPTTLAASYAFMLPIATPPNAIIFESERVPVKAMVSNGIWINLFALILLNSIVTLMVSWILL